MKHVIVTEKHWAVASAMEHENHGRPCDRSPVTIAKALIRARRRIARICRRTRFPRCLPYGCPEPISF